MESDKEIDKIINMEIENENFIFRCNNCLKIPIIKLNNDNNVLSINYSCKCTLKKEIKSKRISLDNFNKNFTEISFNSMICSNCSNVRNENIKRMFLCFTCKKPFCSQCKIYHQKKIGHNMNININKFDSYCIIHNEYFTSWCVSCRKNLCKYCVLKHEKCEKKNFNEIKIKNSDFEIYKSKLKNILYKFDKYNKKLKKIMIGRCITEDDKNEILYLYKQNYNKNILLLKILINIFNTYSLYQMNLNYQIIENIKIFSSLNTGIKFDENNSIEENKEYIKSNFIINFLNYENIDKKKIYPLEFNNNSFKFNQYNINSSNSNYSNNTNYNSNNNNCNSSFYNNNIDYNNNNNNNFDNIIIYNNNNNNNFDNNIKNDINNNIFKKFENNFHEIKNINKKIDIRKLKKIKTIKNEPKKSITYLLVLHNKRLAMANCNFIELINETSLMTILKIKRHKYQISTLTQLKDEKKRLVSGDIKGNIKLWIFDDKQYECNGNIKSEIENLKILKLIHLSNQNLATLTEKIIEIWDINSQKSNKKILQKKNDNNHKFSSLLETKNNILVSSSPTDYLRTYDINTLERKKKLKDVNCSSLNSLIEINDNKIVIGGNSKIFIVNMNCFEVEYYINVDGVVSSLYLLNDNTLLFGQDNLKLGQYDIDNKKCLGFIENANPCFIISSCQISNKYIITASFIQCIFWEIKE